MTVPKSVLWSFIFVLNQTLHLLTAQLSTPHVLQLLLSHVRCDLAYPSWNWFVVFRANPAIYEIFPCVLTVLTGSEEFVIVFHSKPVKFTQVIDTFLACAGFRILFAGSVTFALLASHSIDSMKLLPSCFCKKLYGITPCVDIQNS